MPMHVKWIGFWLILIIGINTICKLAGNKNHFDLNAISETLSNAIVVLSAYIESVNNILVWIHKQLILKKNSTFKLDANLMSEWSESVRRWRRGSQREGNKIHSIDQWSRN